MKKFVFLFGIVFLLFSCEKNELTNPGDVNNQDLMLKSGKPDQPGDNFKVIRYNDQGIFYQLYDKENDLTAFVGVDIRKLLSSGSIDAFDVLDIQSIVKEGGENEILRVHILVNQDAIVEVWKGNINDVSQLLSADPIYSGTGHVVFTDNDHYSFYNDNKNTSVWGLRLNGEGINIKYHALMHGHDPSTVERSVTIMLN